MSEISTTIKYVAPKMEIGTSCLICDSFVPLEHWRPSHAEFRICEECKKRLMKLLYGGEDG